MARVIPFGRPLKQGSRGKDVLAVKRGLARAGFGPRRLRVLTRTFGPFTKRHLTSFQRAHGVRATGQYGRGSHAKLAPFFDDRAAFLYAGPREREEPPEAAERRRIVAAAMLLYQHRAEVHYTQSAARMQGVRQRLRPPQFPVWEDCSSGATWCYFAAGAQDPNRRGYDGFGYTGTLCQHGEVVPLARAKPGDLVFYGRGAPWGHVAIYLGQGRVWSHGSEGGPYLLPVDYRRDRGEIRRYI